MEPVIGLDVAKESSVIQSFLQRDQSYGKAVIITNDERGFKQLRDIATELKTLTGMDAIVILESTGHYHRNLVSYLAREEIRHFIINPLQSKRSRSIKLRKVKTDATDASALAEMYYRGDARPHRIWTENHLELQHVTRHHEFVTSLYVQAKLNTRALLDQVFPQYESVFRDLFGLTALKVLLGCLHGKSDEIEKALSEVRGVSRSQAWSKEKKLQLDEVMRLWMAEKRSLSQKLALEGMVSLLMAFRAQLDQLDKQIEELASTLPEIALIRSIPGIGSTLAAAIVSEIGDAKQFASAKQLVAFAGLDPGVYSSGKFTASRSRITKRGSKKLRRALYLAVRCSLRRGVINTRLQNYYDKKKKEGKPSKVAVIACANKLLHHIYAILSHGQPYKD